MYPENRNNGGCLRSILTLSFLSWLLRPRYRRYYNNRGSGCGCLGLIMLAVGLSLIFASAGRTFWSVAAGIVLLLGGLGSFGSGPER